MKRGRSTGKPTKEEAEWIVAVKEGPCLACYLWTLGGWWCGCDAHHLMSGGRRIGHMATIGLCAYHHRGILTGEGGFKAHRDRLGPSLMDGSRTFHGVFGPDSELLELQKLIVAGRA